MDEPDELTVIQALETINAREPHIIQYFRARGLLDILPDPSLKWASDRMFRKLQQRFKRKIFSNSLRLGELSSNQRRGVYIDFLVVWGGA